jgi:hypothetical protein
MMAFGKINMPEPQETHLNPAKAWLYQDPFLGIYDLSVTENLPAYYAQVAKELTAAAGRSATLGDLFLLQAHYADAVSKKCDLGVRARALYRAHDLEGLRALAEHDFPAATTAVKELHHALETVWFSDNKPQGYETHDIRLGGLVSRLESCADRLSRYVSGALSSLPELEEELLPERKSFAQYPGEQMWSWIVVPSRQI